MKRSPLRRGSRLRQVSAKRAAKAGAYAHLRALVHAREGGSCARCGMHIPITEGECHHRLARSRGGQDTPENCVWLCRHDHHVEIHGSPMGATHFGWLVPSGVDPAEWPVYRTHRGVTGWWQPGPDGWLEATPHERQVAA